MRVAVAVPCNWGYVPTAFFTSASRMFAAAQRKHELGLLVNAAPYLDEMRESLAVTALEREADCVVWLDTDQIYPADTIIRLVEHVEAGREVVGGVTPSRPSGKPHVWRFINDSGACVRDDKFTAGRGVVKVDALGFGGVATSARALRAIAPPRFLRRWDEEHRSFIGEDFSFYSRCRDNEIDVWCDTDLVFDHVAVGTIKLICN